tara:strand:+ start:5541 stop:5810 length:270 start_codon:yes stop_codon:yes gene_type:complete
MKAMAKLKNLNGNEDKRIIIRNLSRIMDIRIVDIDVEKGTIGILSSTMLALEQVRRELWRICYPVKSWKLSGSTPNHSKKVVMTNTVLA